MNHSSAIRPKSFALFAPVAENAMTRKGGGMFADGYNQLAAARWIELRVPKAETRVVLFTPEGDEKRIGSFMNMSYACDDIDKTYAELKKRGVEFEGPPEKQPWGTYAMFKDSDGNRFVVSAE